VKKKLLIFKLNYRAYSASFFLAFLLWFAIATDKEYTHVIDVPLEIETLADNLVLKEMPPKTIKLKIKGNGRSLIGLNFINQKIGIEFPEITHDQVIDLEEYKDKFQFPQDLGIEVIDVVSPQKIELDVDAYAERKLPVKIINSIKAVPGYLLVDYIPEIDSVWVKGPKTFINAMKEVETENVKRSDVRFPFEDDVNLENKKPDVIKIEPSSIKVNFNIEPLVERTIYNIPIRIVNTPKDLEAEATPETISLRVKGGESRVSALAKDDIDILFNYEASFKSGQANYPMQIKTPDDITWVEASPKTFSLKLVRKEEGF
jgi:YbbR-like protein